MKAGLHPINTIFFEETVKAHWFFIDSTIVSNFCEGLNLRETMEAA